MAKAVQYQFQGEKMTLNRISAITGIDPQTIRNRILGGNMSLNDCFTRKKIAKSRITIDLGIRTPFVATETNEDLIIVKDQICSWFGCHKKLSLQEKLFGNTCINHQ